MLNPGSNKCSRCKKTVYHAEQKLAEGSVWHNLCWSLEFKEREKRKKEMKEAISYQKPADVQPSYYRVADVDTGEPPRMESSKGVIPINQYHPEAPPVYSPPVNQSTSAQPARFCPECGTKRGENDKFCASCGHKL